MRSNSMRAFLGSLFLIGQLALLKGAQGQTVKSSERKLVSIAAIVPGRSYTAHYQKGDGVWTSPTYNCTEDPPAGLGEYVYQKSTRSACYEVVTLPTPQEVASVCTQEIRQEIDKHLGEAQLQIIMQKMIEDPSFQQKLRQLIKNLH